MDIESFLKENNNTLDNSFSQSVFEIEDNQILKVFDDINRGKTELLYLNYFYNKLNVPKVLDSGKIDNKFYILMEKILGNNYSDEEKVTFSNETYLKMGTLLAKMHTLDIIEEDNWKEYMLYRIDKNYNYLKEKENFDFDKIYYYLKENTKKLHYRPVCMHSDFRLGNLIINENISLIDLESVKSGDAIFDFVKLYRILSNNQFNILKEGYEKIVILDKDFEEKLHFYNLYDAFTTMGWCIEVNRYNSDFYNFNFNFLKKEIDYLWKEEAIQKDKKKENSI